MDTPYPLPRQTRESGPLVGNGTVGPYGPSTFKIFDTVDVQVFARAVDAPNFENVTDDVTIAKTSSAPFATFTITFDAAVPVTTQWYYLSDRLHERSIAITRGGTIDSDQLEKELSKQGTILQEQWRDLQSTVKFPPDYDGNTFWPLPGAGKLIGYAADGQSLVASETTIDERSQRIAGDEQEARLRAAGDAAEAAARSAADASEAAIRQAMDTYLHGLINDRYTSNTLSPNLISSAVALMDMNVDPEIAYLWVAGYQGPGDRGNCLRKWVAAPEPGAVQSLDGAWWAIAEPVLRPEMFGILHGVDQTAELQEFADYAATKKLPVDWPAGGDYRLTAIDLIVASGAGAGSKVVDWRFPGGPCKFTSTKTVVDPSDDWAIRLRGSLTVGYPLTADAQMGQDWVAVADPSIFQPGDILEVRSTRLIQTDHRGTGREGQTGLVRSIDAGAGRVYLQEPIQYFAPANDSFTGAVVAVGSTRELTLPASVDRPERDMMCRFTMTSGAQTGQQRYCTEWDNSAAKKARFDGSQAAWGPIAPGDTFLFEWRSDAVRCEPIKVSIGRGFHLTRQPTFDAVADDDGFIGLRVLLADQCSLDGIKVENFSYANIAVTSCYEPRVERCRADGANRLYNLFDGTGYGIAIGSCWHAVVANNTGRRNRRLIDFGGPGTALNWFGECLDNTAYGGGKDYTGGDMFPTNPDAQNGCVGSHGQGYGTIYRGNKAIDTYNLYNLRGLNERIESGYGYGYMRLPVLMQHCGGEIIEGVHYEDTFSEIGRDGTTRYYKAGTPGLRPGTLIQLWCDTKPVLTKPTRIFNCTANKILTSAISFTRGDGADDPVWNLEYGNIRVIASLEGQPANVFRFIRTDTPRDIKNFTDLGGNQYSFDGVEFTSFSLTEFASDLRIATNEFVRLPGNRYLANIALNGAIRIPVGNASPQARVSIYDMNRDRTYRAVDMILAVDRNLDYSPLSASNKTAPVELANIPLTGASGTAGAITLAYRPASEGYLYIENRIAGLDPARPIIAIEQIP